MITHNYVLVSNTLKELPKAIIVLTAVFPSWRRRLNPQVWASIRPWLVTPLLLLLSGAGVTTLTWSSSRRMAAALSSTPEGMLSSNCSAAFELRCSVDLGVEEGTSDGFDRILRRTMNGCIGNE